MILKTFQEIIVKTPPIPGMCCVISCLSHFGRGSHINLGSRLLIENTPGKSGINGGSNSCNRLWIIQNTDLVVILIG